MKQKLLSILTLLVLCVTGAWGQGLIYSHGFENGTDSWSKSSMGTATSESTVKRTGGKSLSYTCSNASGYARKGGLTYTKGYYIHAIMWVKSTGDMNFTIKLNGGESSQFPVNNSDWTRIYHSINYTSSTGAKNTDVLPHSATGSFYIDDVVLYYSSSSTTDLTAPTSATSASANASAISWTVGTDANTGVQKTLIFKRTSGSDDDLTLNDQGIYSLTAAEGPSTDQSGHWTLVAVVNGDATSYSGTFTSGDVYAIVHRDLAYNYSTPAYVTVVAAAPTYTITLDDNGDYNGNGTATATEGSAILTDIVAPTRDGYTVEGYYKEEACTNKIADAEGNLQANTDYTDGDGNWTSTSDEITLFAKWEEAAKYTVTHTLTNLTTSSGATGDNAATQGVEYTAVLAPSAYYSLPASITVTIGGEAATEGTAYTWNSTTGEVVVGASYVQGAIVITAAGVRNTLENAPTITAGDFNFANHGYAVTITNNEAGSTLKYSTDNEIWNDYTGTLYATTTTHYYAKSVKDNYDDSEVADKNVTNTFDPAKSYIAWVYQSQTYTDNSVTYNLADDGIYLTLKDIYNVVPMAISNTTSITAEHDIKNADLIINAEAMSGSSNLAVGMKNFLGVKPMMNFKIWCYGSSTDGSKRWGWGKPGNVDESGIITPTSTTYKLLDGVTLDEGNVNLFSGTTGRVQTVNWTSAPTNNVNMATNTNVAMHAIIDNDHLDKQFFGFGVSCNYRTQYSENTKTIVKNAAAMLLAGTERLDAEITTISVNIGSREWASFSSTYPLDFTGSGITAYKATSDDGDAIHLQSVTKVPAATGLLLYGSEGSHTVTVTSESTDDMTDNLLKAGPKTVSAAEAEVGKIYAFGVKNGQVGFVKAAEGYSVAFGKSYLDLTETAAKGIEFFAIDDAVIDDYTTGINTLNSRTSTLDPTAPIYNVSGQRVSDSYKGVVIQNGKKYIRK